MLCSGIRIQYISFSFCITKCKISVFLPIIHFKM